MTLILSDIPEKQPQRPSTDGWSLDARSVVEVYTIRCVSVGSKFPYVLVGVINESYGRFQN